MKHVTIDKPKHRRADPHRTAGMATPKVGVRVRDEDVYEAVRAIGYCELDPRHPGPFTPHHWKSRGAGGGDTWDNLCCLCELICHEGTHKGNVSRDDVRAVIDARETLRQSGRVVEPFDGA